MPNIIQTEEIKEAILDATDRLIANYGYKKMTIDDLAREVGIGKGSIYLHFSSKQEIALTLIDRVVERVKTELETIEKSRRFQPSEKLRRMILARVLVRFDNMRHYTRSLNEIFGALRIQLMERRSQHSVEEAEIFARVIDQGQERKIFQAGECLQLAETLLLATNSLLPSSLTTRELGKRKEVREKTLQLANLLLTGLENKKKPAFKQA